jgi:hypothetical protein
LENLKGREHSEDLSIGKKTILKCILEKYVGDETGLIWLRTGSVVGSCEHSNQPTFGFHERRDIS